ncbi:hypothetical protein [Rhizobium indigoferae]|nr:hypothetical protein [Rhizobium indigoferae]
MLARNLRRPSVTMAACMKTAQRSYGDAISLFRALPFIDFP